jgi:hypothetical protein
VFGINRLSLNEMTPQRLAAAFGRRMKEIPHSLAWHFNTPDSRLNQIRLKQWKDVHAGERCFVMGNGPSLGKMDLSPLKHELTFGLNRIYLLFEKIDFYPTYYVAINELVLEQFAQEIKTVPSPKFLNWTRRDLFDLADPTIHFLKTIFPLQDRFNIDITKPLCIGATVTFVALQIAYYMGFHKVILIGVDHSFVEKGTPNIIEVRTPEADESHFTHNYFPKGVKWQLPDLKHSEISYELAREAFKYDGRTVLDATIGGKCPVFAKVDYHTLF